MPREEDLIRLRHMLDAAREAIEHATGRSRADLETDRQFMHTLVRLLQIIGEAASEVSEPCRGELPDIRWRSIVGMRHRLVHAYYDIDLAIAWKTVQEDLPPLVAQLGRVLGEQGGA